MSKAKSILIPYHKIIKIFAFDRFPVMTYEWKHKRTFLGFTTQKEGWYQWDFMVGDSYLGEELSDEVLEKYLVEDKEVFEFPGVRIIVDGAKNIEIPKKSFVSAQQMVKEVKNRMRHLGIHVLDTEEYTTT